MAAFSDNSSGICQCDHGIEDTSHFLFSCTSHAIHRAVIVTVVNEILLKFILESSSKSTAVVLIW